MLLYTKFFRRWLFTSLIVGVFYELIWAPIDYIGEHYSMIFLLQCISIDMMVCLIFSFFNSLVLEYVWKFGVNMKWNVATTVSASILIIFFNILISLPLSKIEMQLFDLIVECDDTSDYYNYIETYVLGSVGIIITICNLLLLQSEQLKKKDKLLADMEIQMLRNKVNPHFLFNNLNVGIALINQDSSRAVHFFTTLAKLYRFILDNTKKKIHTLKEECDMLNCYMDLLYVRFGNAVQVKWNLSEADYKKRIMSGCLQLLFENAIKHNKFSEREPLHIFIECHNNKLIVINEIKPLIVNENGYGVGQQIILNTHSDLGFYGVRFIKTDNKYRVEIPLENYENTDN